MGPFQCVLFFLIFFGGIARGKDVNFRDECEPALPGELVDCSVTLTVDCQGTTFQTGLISSPGSPDRMTDTTRFDKYKLGINSCPSTVITLAINRTSFLLGSEVNTFTVGNGNQIDADGQILEPRLNGGHVFDKEIFTYESVSSSIWIEADVSYGEFWFDITYSVSKVDVSTSNIATITTSSIKQQEVCLCNQTDVYKVVWTTSQLGIMVKNCSEAVPEASGNSTWTCGYVDGQCKFLEKQPNFTQCRSTGLEKIIDSVDDDTKDVTEIWTTMCKYIKRGNTYFGREIFDVIDAVNDLLDRQECEMNNSRMRADDSTRYLPKQINSSYYGAETIDYLIENKAQWEELTFLEMGDEGIIRLLDVSNEVGFHLSLVSQMEGKPLLCDFAFENVIISSSNWDSNQSTVLDCTTETHVSHQEHFIRFPRARNGSESDKIGSYILLPSEIREMSYRGSGVFIPDSSFVKQLLPGINNSRGMTEKEVNSPLISYTLYHPGSREPTDIVTLPDDLYVQLVFEHETRAKYPPFLTIRRDLEEGELASPVVGSSLCSYLFLNEDKNEVESWIWDDQGCRVVSTNRTHTVCKCNHLTGFANLMDFHKYEPSPELDATSMMCSILSIICLASTFAILTTFKSLKMNRTFLSQNLCITLLISHMMILITLNRHLLNLNDSTCAAMGILLHYVLLVSFMWMFIEGFQLYRMSVNVFDVWTEKWKIYNIILAYTIPFLIVCITVISANAYYEPISEEDVVKSGILQVYSGDDETCWLVGEQWMWAFSGPVAFIILVIHFCFKLLRKERGMKLRVISLTFFLGLTWITGFLLYFEPIAIAFIFTIANGLQGVSIFIDRCVLNIKIRTALMGSLKRIPTYVNGLTGKEATGERLNNSPSYIGMNGTVSDVFNFTITDVVSIIPRVNSGQE